MKRWGRHMERNHSSRRSAVTRSIAGLVISTGSLLAAAGVASSSAHKAQTPLQRGLAFYNGKTVKFISPDAPGGGYDTWARILAPYLQKYLNATVDVVNIPQANTVTGQDQTEASPSDGLTVGWLNTIGDIEETATDTPGLNFNPERVAFIGSTAANTTVWVVSPNTTTCPLRTWSALETQTTLSSPVSLISQTQGTSFTFGMLSRYAFGISEHVITGYPNTSSIVSGFLRGDGCTALLGLSSAGPLLQAGKADVLAYDNPPPSSNPYSSYLPASLNIASFEKAFKATTIREKDALSAFNGLSTLDGRILFTQQKVSSDKVAALRWAMQKAMANPNLEQQAIGSGNNTGFIGGAALKQRYINGLQIGKRVASLLSAG